MEMHRAWDHKRMPVNIYYFSIRIFETVLINSLRGLNLDILLMDPTIHQYFFGEFKRLRLARRPRPFPFQT